MKALSTEELQKKIEDANKSVVSEPVAEQDLISDNELMGIINFGRIEEEFDIVPGLKVKMHTLAEQERQEALSMVSIGKDGETKIAELKVPFLTYAITKINQYDIVTPEQRKKLQAILNKTQTPVLDKIFVSYASLLTKQDAMLTDGFKKKD